MVTELKFLNSNPGNKGLAGLMVDSDTSYSSNSGTNTTAAPGQYRIFHISEFKGPIQIQMVRREFSKPLLVASCNPRIIHLHIHIFFYKNIHTCMSRMFAKGNF